MEVKPCTSTEKTFGVGRKLEVDVELCSDHYIVVSCLVDGHEFHGILLKAQKDGVHSPFDVDGKKFDEWKNLVSNNFASWDAEKMSSLCLRQTCFDESKFNSFKIRHPHGIRRLDSRPVRLRPVASQRSTVLCARCQQQRVAITSRHSFVSSTPNSKRNSNSISSETKKKEKAKKAANAQFFFERLFAKKQAAQSVLADVKLQQKPIVNLQHIDVVPPPPPPPLTVQPRIPTLKITFGKSDSKTVTVINGRPASSPWTEKPTSSQSDAKSEDAEPSTVPAETTIANDSQAATLPEGMRVDDIVWAKMQSYPYWPAKIFDVYERTACVTWCGSTQYGYVDVSILEPFVKCFNKRYNAKRSGSYQKAVADAVRNFKEISENAYYVSLLSPACRKYVNKLKIRSAAESSDKQQSKHKKQSASPRIAPVSDSMQIFRETELIKKSDEIFKRPEMISRSTSEMISRPTPDTMSRSTPEMISRSTPEMINRSTPAGIPKKPASAGISKRPMSEGILKRPIPAEITKKPIPAETPKRPTPAGFPNKPTSAGLPQRPTTEGILKRPTPAGILNRPRSEGIIKNQTSAGYIKNPTPTGILKNPTPAGILKNHTPAEILKKPTTVGIINKPTPAGILKKPMSLPFATAPNSQPLAPAGKIPRLPKLSTPPPVGDDESDPDASPRLVIDEYVEESFEQFAKRSRLSGEQAPVDHLESSASSDQSSSSAPASLTKGQGTEMDFDSVLSELQEMNDMCAAGSNSSLLTSC